FHFDKLYTYLVPTHLKNQVFVGSMVLVPFGYGTSARMGVVLGTKELTEDMALKSIFDVAPEGASLTGELLDLVYYLKEMTFCTYYDAVKAVIPYGAQYKAVSTGTLPKLQKQISQHKQTVYSINCINTKLTLKQQMAIDIIKDGETSRSVLVNSGVSKAVLDNMCKKGILSDREIDKSVLLYDDIIAKSDPIVLSNSQQIVFDKLKEDLNKGVFKKALLYGITSSGKTLIFIKLIEEVINMGRQAIVLVPEISLTPQMIYRLKGFFGDRVAVQHSALSNTERLLQWLQIQKGEADIVVGTRSAIFAPLSKLGLIIIDEEQEHTYHSDSSPRYDARDIAKKRAFANNSLLVLASATPSTETYYEANTGKMELLELNERYNNMPLPKVKLVDMRTELASGNTSSISTELANEIQYNLDNSKQTILLLNRRGYKTVGVCASCCKALKCSACSVPLVYHKAQDRLLCHYCGKSISPIPEICPECGGKIRYTGFGTQRIEEELEILFPKARVLRMDLDTTGRKNSHEQMLKKFANCEYDIMIGTQMVAKVLTLKK
ncbi:MAG: primosomal protein N', partial [Oscillospiraceae bacterium]